ncbi:Crp/Fnr family transcriptional regulator [Listeria swaminathanii]|uniref:Crp/Fnr family transcriptional regulator n=1 Tax=Listeria swaminathanii TaxID=2713501 RepID=A0ABU2IFM7_9LIST|nr:Crp/Fnr family transcriptional regulator [Listeria swaminathanii]MDT0018173.1 Crp/Fnr family transcriptional regulator [Listeria swaminathanii]MDT0022568.1 Crp/Fnr family transcriptional regulator [Listeria swaminathanii]MDT0033532.1 Crp/Fnr family transcriptional regulator [Listeria swaminathanii]MDT0052516.1 Crp/Fnr family transcriptional regulator [Listeria swaminathanii]MDT0055281.1 Crp/Fnr family transcriptional regulator [Listeria swaminathanii]
MYLKETLDQFASIDNILKLLKKNPSFNKHCRQERLPEKMIMAADKTKNDVYIIEEGFIKLIFAGDSNRNFSYIVSKGAFLHLPIYSEDIPQHTAMLSLTDVVWWKIDFHYFKTMMALEDPKNYLMLHQLAETRKRLYLIAFQEQLPPRKRVYYALNMMIDFGLEVSEKAVELPPFLTYQVLADYANTSKSYSSKVLGDLRKQGILESQKKPWRINDVQKLQHLMETNIPLVNK